MGWDSMSEPNLDTFTDAYLSAIHSADSLEQGVEAANGYLQRRFAASITDDAIQPGTPAGEELHALDLGFDAEYDSYLIGHGLEKVVNELYGDTGSYYTPEEIVAFMAEGTIHARLLARLGVDTNEFERVDDWVSSDANVNAEAALEEARTLTVCDPACGSGHFLIAAHDELVRLQARFCEILGKDIPMWRLARETAEKCIYGVDIIPEAVRMSKLRLRLNVLKHLPPRLAEQYVGADTHGGEKGTGTEQTTPLTDGGCEVPPTPPRLDDLVVVDGPTESGIRISFSVTETADQERRVSPPIHFYNVDAETLMRQVPSIGLDAGETVEWEMGFVFFGDFEPSVGDTILTAVGEQQQVIEVCEVTADAD